VNDTYACSTEAALPRRKTQIDIAELTRLYLEERLPTSELSARFGVSWSVLQRRLREAGVPPRRLSNLMLAVEEMRRLYEEEQWGTPQLGEKYGVNAKTIGYHLTKAGVVLRPTGGKTKPTSMTDDELRRLYWDEQLSTAQIAARMGRPHCYVRERMVRAGIPRRPVGEARKLRAQLAKVSTKS
jgi:hypothetical protein